MTSRFLLNLVAALLLASLALASDVPKNAKLEIRLNEELSSDTSTVGQKFTATLNREVSLGKHVTLGKGALVEGVVKGVKPTYNFQKPGELDLELVSVKSGGKIYSVRTNLLVMGGKAEYDPSNAHPLDEDQRPGGGVVRGTVGGMTVGTDGVTQTIPGTNVSVGSASERSKLEVRLPEKFKLTFKLEWASEGKAPE